MSKLTAKAINCKIRDKIKDWLMSITDENVRKLAAKDVIVSGGCITSMLLDERIRDYDVYFRTRNTVEAIANYYVTQFSGDAGSCLKVIVTDDRVSINIKSAGIAGELPVEDEADSDVNSLAANIDLLTLDPNDSVDAPDTTPYRPVFFSDNAITLSDGIQLIIRFYGEPEEIHKNFDYVHCTNYWTPADGLVCNTAALMSTQTMELRYTGSKYPLCALIRTRKFIARGWKINAGQYVKMVFHLNELNLNNIDVLSDQLIGVDTEYFRRIIDILSKHALDGIIDSAYVIEIIDRMF